MTRSRGWIVALTAGLALAACGDDAPEKPAGPAKTAPAAPKKAVVGDEMVAAVSAGKSATAIGVYFELGDVPTIDAALPVDIVIVPHQDFTSLQARVLLQGEGLTLVSGDLLQPISDVKAETSIPHKLVLMPRKEGVYMVTVNLDTQASEGSVSRIFSIPVIVAAAGGASTPAPAATPPAPATN